MTDHAPDDDLTRRLGESVESATPDLPPPYDGLAARRASRRRRRRRALTAAVTTIVVVGAVAAGAAVLRPGDRASGPSRAVDPAASTTPPADPSPTEPSVPTTPAEPGKPVLPDVAPDWDGKGAPPVFLRRADGGLAELEPWSACYGNRCFDGFPQAPFEDAGDQPAVSFSFPFAGWEFQATFTPIDGGRCARTITVDAEATGDYAFRVPATGPADTYRVDLFGRAPQGGDIVTSFAWVTSEAGDIPAPTGYVGVLSSDGGDLRSYGVELGVQGLARSYPHASATVTVTAADGASDTFGPYHQRERCLGEGSVFLSGPESDTKGVSTLGPGPFRYGVELVLDGTKYVGTAVWPRDERPDEAPYADLTFDPPLPALTG